MLGCSHTGFAPPPIPESYPAAKVARRSQTEPACSTGEGWGGVWGGVCNSELGLDGVPGNSHGAAKNAEAALKKYERGGRVRVISQRVQANAERSRARTQSRKVSDGLVQPYELPLYDGPQASSGRMIGKQKTRQRDRQASRNSAAMERSSIRFERDSGHQSVLYLEGLFDSRAQVSVDRIPEWRQTATTRGASFIVTRTPAGAGSTAGLLDAAWLRGDKRLFPLPRGFVTSGAAEMACEEDL